MSNKRIIWLSAEDPPGSFPPVDSALSEPDGLLAAGGDLSTTRLLHAYRNGIFPWYEEGQPLLWWSPDPRCVFRPGDFHVSRRLARELRLSSAEIRINAAFPDVVRHCAGPRKSQQGTWITAAIMAAFDELNAAGWARSIEVWQSGELVGGLYGLAIGKAFFGESMFSLNSNASKYALLYLANRLDAGDIEILDCQVTSTHLLSLGARAVPRGEFITMLESACEPAKMLSEWTDTAVASLRIPALHY